MPKPVPVPYLGRSERLVHGLGLNAVKTGLVAALAARNDMATSRELADALGIRQQLASHHLRDLEAAGLVRADRSDPRRGGAPVRWILRRDELETEWNELAQLLRLQEG